MQRSAGRKPSYLQSLPGLAVPLPRAPFCLAPFTRRRKRLIVLQRWLVVVYASGRLSCLWPAYLRLARPGGGSARSPLAQGRSTNASCSARLGEIFRCGKAAVTAPKRGRRPWYRLTRCRGSVCVPRPATLHVGRCRLSSLACPHRPLARSKVRGMECVERKGEG